MRLGCTLIVASFWFTMVAAAADPVPLVTAHGKVVKVEKDHLAFQPRGSGGKFGKTVMLRLTGTSKIATLAPQMRDKKLVLTQKETDAKDLKAGQLIAVIYGEPKGGEPVLLSAVVEPPVDK